MSFLLMHTVSSSNIIKIGSAIQLWKGKKQIERDRVTFALINNKNWTFNERLPVENKNDCISFDEVESDSKCMGSGGV